jgi:hypothetical protein
MNQEQIKYESLYLNSDNEDNYSYDSEHEKIINLSLSENNDNDNEDKKQIQQTRHIITQIKLNESIIEERNEEIEKIYKDITDINEIFKDLNKLIVEQTEPINKIEEQCIKAVQETEKGVEHLKQAETYNNKWFSKRNKIILLSIAGLSINVPITLALGIKAGVISGLSTVGFSALTTLFT